MAKEPANKPKRERKAAVRSGKPVSVYMPLNLYAALKIAVRKSRRNLSTEVVIAVEEYLTRSGLWTPPTE